MVVDPKALPIERVSVVLCTTRGSAASLASRSSQLFMGRSQKQLAHMLERLLHTNGPRYWIEQLTINLGAIAVSDFESAFMQRLLDRLEQALLLRTAEGSMLLRPAAGDADGELVPLGRDALSFVRARRNELGRLTDDECEGLARAVLQPGASKVILDALVDQERYELCRRVQLATVVSVTRSSQQHVARLTSFDILPPPLPSTLPPALPFAVAQAMLAVCALILIGNARLADAPMHQWQALSFPADRRLSAWLAFLLAMRDVPLPAWSQWQRRIAAEPVARMLAEAASPEASRYRRKSREAEASGREQDQRGTDAVTNASETPALRPDSAHRNAAVQGERIDSPAAHHETRTMRFGEPDGMAEPAERVPARLPLLTSSVQRASPQPEKLTHAPVRDIAVHGTHRVQSNDTQLDPKSAPDFFAVANAGLVLLWPFLPKLFRDLELFDEADFVDVSARHHAANWLDALIWPDAEPDIERSELTRLLCGLPFNDPQEKEENEPPPDKETRAAIQAWFEALPTRIEGLHRCAPNDLRTLFLQRPGALLRYPRYDELTVFFHASDFLLVKLPWSLTRVPWPWLERPLSVRWPIPQLDFQ